MFLYYTNLSNLVTAVFSAALLLGSFWPGGGLWRALNVPAVRLAMTLGIVVTGLVYWTMLAPGAARRGESLAAGRLSSLLLHGAAPLLSLVGWIAFADKKLRAVDALWWLLAPAAYFAFILVRARFRGPIPGRTSPYPYHFMNLDRLGPRRFACTVALMMAGFCMLGLAFVGLSHLLK